MTELTEDQVLSALPTTPVAEAGRELYEKAVAMWRDRRAKRLELQRQMNEQQKIETALKSFLIEVFREQKLEGCLIDGRITGLNTKPVATVSDKEQLVAFIKETGDISLLQFRLATGTVDEYVAAERSVPGVEYIDVYDLSDKKA